MVSIMNQSANQLIKHVSTSVQPAPGANWRGLILG